ncbi:MAG: hypothetical protein WAM11_10675, partial [Cyanobium sp.]
SRFFIFVVAFLLTFLLNLINDIDNSFGLADPDSAEYVSLAVLNAAASRLQVLVDESRQVPAAVVPAAVVPAAVVPAAVA